MRHEFGRKAFHLLSLIYLAAYTLIGWPAVLPWMLAWTAVVAVLETWRLRSPRLNEALTGFFGGLARPEEKDKYSGVIHTTLGVLAVMALFGREPRLVAAGIYCAAFGDAAAALFGKAFGRHKIRTGKSIEGSLACFVVCLLVGWSNGFSSYSTILAAAAASLVEILPTTRWLNDNLWMPIVMAGVLALCRGS